MRFEPLTESRIGDVKRLWNSEWGAVFPMREKIAAQNVFGDRNMVAAGSWLAVDEATGEAAGCVVAKCWQDRVHGVDFGRGTGYIHLLVVAPAFRGIGVGGELLTRAERALAERGATQVELGNDFHLRVCPGVPEPCEQAAVWLEKRGYARQGIVHDLFRDDEGGETVPLPQPEGVRLRLLRREEADAFNAFMRRVFPGRWEYQTLAYWERGGTGREFVVAEKDGELIGFCRINDSSSPLLAQNVYWSLLFEQELGGIGPLGIDERFRGNGYGLAIVQAGLHFLHARGIRKTVIDTTPYVDFYGKLGYRTWRSYRRFRKTMTASN